MTWETLMLTGLLFGVAYGFLFQKGDFCFVAAFRDYFGFKDTRVLGGIVAAVLVTLVGAAFLLQFGLMGYDRLWVVGGGWTSVVGGFAFGAAMYYAGSCASGTLYRCGMGYVHFWITLAAMGVGYLVFARLYEPFLFDAIGRMEVLPASSAYESTGLPFLATALLLVGFLAAWAVWQLGWPAVRRQVSEAVGFLRQPPVQLLRAKAWDARTVGLLIGLLVLVQMLILSPLSITGPETRMAATVASAFTGEVAILANPYLSSLFSGYGGVGLGPTELLIIGIIVGSALSGVLSGSWRLRKPRLQRLPNAVLGGLVMGVSSRIAPGCNVANILTGVPALSAHSILAAAGLIVGVWAAQKVDQWKLNRAIEAATRAAAEVREAPPRRAPAATATAARAEAQPGARESAGD